MLSCAILTLSCAITTSSCVILALPCAILASSCAILTVVEAAKLSKPDLEDLQSDPSLAVPQYCLPSSTPPLLPFYPDDFLEKVGGAFSVGVSWWIVHVIGWMSFVCTDVPAVGSL